MFERRRQTKKLIQIARMLRALDNASAKPASRSRATARVMLRG
jgi:hypothetical protein